MRVPMVAGLAAWVGLVLGHVASYALAYPRAPATASPTDAAR
jgi:hypothetical protein